VVKVKPEAAVEFEDGERGGLGLVLDGGERSFTGGWEGRSRQRKRKKRDAEPEAREGASGRLQGEHESKDGIANERGQQITDGAPANSRNLLCRQTLAA